MENTEAHLPVTTSSLVIISFSQQPGENRFKVINDSPTYQQPVFTFRSVWFQSPSTSCWIRRKVFLWLGSVQSLSHVQLFATPWTAAHQASVSITNSRSFLKLISSVGDAIQPSHPPWSPSPALNLSQHQGLFKWVSSLHQVAKVLEFQLQHQTFQWTPRTDFL